ncbi:MAG: hypothetical protein AAFU85_10870 [Planctomycetota bacterium]
MFYNSNWIELQVSNAIQPVTKAELKIRFDSIQDFPKVSFELGDILAKTFQRKQFAPKAPFNCLKAERSARSAFPWQISIALAPLRKPYSFRCKRIFVTTKRGKHLAGDCELPKHEWKAKDYKELARAAADRILLDSYDELLCLMDDTLRKKKSPEKLSAEFARWKKAPKSASARGGTEKRTDKAAYGIRITHTDEDGLPIPDQARQGDD